MADSENQQPVDTTQQVTSPTPTTRQKKPKRVAAGKAIAEKTKQAREQQKKAVAEAQLIIANHKLRKKDEPPVAAPVAAPVADPPVESTINVLTTTQWLSVISIIVSLGGSTTKAKRQKPFSPHGPTRHHLLMSPLNLLMSPLNPRL